MFKQHLQFVLLWVKNSVWKPGTLVTGKMVAALRKLGFDYVFDTDFAADLTIMEEGTELLDRLTRHLKGDKDCKTSDPDFLLPGLG